MDGISDIRIAGVDEKRPPRVRKEPYIDIAFKLSHKAPMDWCKGFNELLSKYKYATKINIAEGLYIETWVRTPDEIIEHLQLLKNKVTECTREYIKKIEEASGAKNDANNDLQQASGEQGRLNQIIAGLDFGD